MKLVVTVLLLLFPLAGLAKNPDYIVVDSVKFLQPNSTSAVMELHSRMTMARVYWAAADINDNNQLRNLAVGLLDATIQAPLRDHNVKFERWHGAYGSLKMLLEAVNEERKSRLTASQQSRLMQLATPRKSVLMITKREYVELMGLLLASNHEQSQ